MKFDRSETLRYLGVRGLPDEQTLALAARGEEEAEKYAKPRFIARRFALEGEPPVLAGEGVALRGQDIARYLRGCSGVYLIAATLGFDAEKRINHLMNTSPALGVATDAACTSALECFLDERCAQLERECGKKLKPRFSCGYGDFPLAQQKDMVRLLDTGRKIGVFLSESMMLAPQKSVTAVVGIAEEECAERGGCADCGKKDCAYKKEPK